MLSPRHAPGETSYLLPPYETASDTRAPLPSGSLIRRRRPALRLTCTSVSYKRHLLLSLPPSANTSCRLMFQLADFSAGRYALSTSHYRDCRSACFKLLGQQAGAGLSLAVAAGVVRGWLRPKARERSAALCRRALVSSVRANTLGGPLRAGARHSAGEVGWHRWNNQRR